MGTNENSMKTYEIQWKPMKIKRKPIKYNGDQKKTYEIQWKSMKTKRKQIKCNGNN